MLVKELQGLGLKVDLVGSNQAEIDAEALLQESIKEESENQSDIDVPQQENNVLDVTEDAVADEFMVLDMQEETVEATVAPDGDKDEEVTL